MILKGLGMSYSHLSGILLSIHHAISMRICSNVSEKDICMVGNVDDEANETTSTAQQGVSFHAWTIYTRISWNIHHE